MILIEENGFFFFFSFFRNLRNKKIKLDHDHQMHTKTSFHTHIQPLKINIIQVIVPLKEKKNNSTRQGKRENIIKNKLKVIP